MSEHQGQQANNNGKWVENDIASRLVSHGYLLCQRPPGEAKPFFIRQASGLFLSLYQTPMTVDFFAWHPIKYPDGLIIEAKHQEISGSVDQKYPYLIGSLKELETPSIVLLLCPGAKPASIAWCVAQQDGHHLRVYTSWESFIYACNRGLL